jgi:hypothetical protein
MAELRGKFRPPAKEADIAAAFPAVAAWLSSRVIADLANLSYLVGMICPGLHSIFSGIAVRLVKV